MVGIVPNDPDGVGQRREWAHLPPTFSDPFGKKPGRFEARGKAVDLAYRMFTFSPSYEQWDSVILSIHNQRCTDLKTVIPTVGWLNYLEIFKGHDPWDWHCKKAISDPNPGEPHHATIPIVLTPDPKGDTEYLEPKEPTAAQWRFQQGKKSQKKKLQNIKSTRPVDPGAWSSKGAPPPDQNPGPKPGQKRGPSEPAAPPAEFDTTGNPGPRVPPYDPRDADVNVVYPRDHELFPAEWLRNVFEEETEAQKKNWHELNKEKQALGGKNPREWQGEKGYEVCRMLVRNNKWTCWSIRFGDLGFDNNGNVKPILKEKLRDIGYPELIRRAVKIPAYKRSLNAFITSDTWERLVGGGQESMAPAQ
jgi:hypothetical protein